MEIKSSQMVYNIIWSIVIFNDVFVKEVHLNPSHPKINIVQRVLIAV